MRSHSNQRINRARRRLAAMLAAVMAALGLAIGCIAAFADGGSGGGPDFEFAVSPQTRTTYLGAATSYGVKVSRLNGFSGDVRLNVQNLPPDSTATWRLRDGSESNVISANLDTAWLVIRTSSTTPLSTRTLRVRGTGYDASDANWISHYVDVTLVVQRLFKVAGGLGRPLYPGLSAPLNLALINPNDFPVSVRKVTAGVARTSEAGCATDNFALAQMPPSDYPITVQPGQSQTLRELGFSNQQMPRLKMVDSGENQDACKGARLTLTYAGKGTR